MPYARQGGQLDWFGQQQVPGYQVSAPIQSGQMDSQQNAAGAASDPFAYTNGSLLTPWTKKFEYGGGTPGAYTPPTPTPFQFGNYVPPNVARMDAPEKFSYADFQAPTAENYQQMDPGAAIREKRGMAALQNSAAARGTLLTGGTAKAIQSYGQESASQEYQRAYDRSLQTYGTSRGNAAENFDRNFGAKLNTFNANTNATQLEGSLGQGAWDRNMSLARTQWQDARDAENAAASAAAGNSAADYNRALREYGMEQDNFRTNQDRQFGMLSDMARMGMSGAGQVGMYGSNYANNAGNIYGQAGNAAAAGQVGANNAWASGISNAGNIALGAYYQNQRQPSQWWNN